MFEQLDYEEKAFVGLEAANEAFEGIEFRECTFQSCDFQGAAFKNCSFTDCVFEDCNLSLIDVSYSHWKASRFSDCKLVGVNWSAANWEKTSLLDKKILRFTGCSLDHNVFMGIDMTKWRLKNCSIREAAFEEALMLEADCRDSDFEKSRFVGTDLSKANFSGAKNYTIHPNLNVIKGAKFSLPEAMALLAGLEIVLVD